jgi:hypothetical protein
MLTVGILPKYKIASASTLSAGISGALEVRTHVFIVGARVLDLQQVTQSRVVLNFHE